MFWMFQLIQQTPFRMDEKMSNDRTCMEKLKVGWRKEKTKSSKQSQVKKSKQWMK